MSTGLPFEFVIAERFGWSLEYIAGLPHRTFLDLIAYIRVRDEQSRKSGR